MGYLGVKTIVAVLRGEEVEPFIATGVRFATKENMAEPEIDELLNPARIFLIDEPTRGIDVGSKAQIYQFVGELAAVRARSVEPGGDQARGDGQRVTTTTAGFPR